MINRNYDILFAGQSVQGAIATLSTLVAGASYVAGSYTGVALTGGKGSGATANITVNGSGVVTVATLVSAGTGYQVGDILSASNANLGGAGSGFSINVATLTSTVNDFVSAPFNLGEVKSEYRSPALRTHGDLDGGAAVIQSLDPSKNRTNADMSLASTDWQDTDDTVDEQAFQTFEFSNLDFRLKLTDVGASANFSAQIVYNAE